MEITLASWINTKAGITFYVIKTGNGIFQMLVLKGEGKCKVVFKKI